MYYIMSDKCGGEYYRDYKYADVVSGQTTIAAEGDCNKYWWKDKRSGTRYMMLNTPPAIRRLCNYQEQDEHGNVYEPGIFRNVCKCYKAPLKKCPLTSDEREARLLTISNLQTQEFGSGKKRKNSRKQKSRKQKSPQFFFRALRAKIFLHKM